MNNNVRIYRKNSTAGEMEGDTPIAKTHDRLSSASHSNTSWLAQSVLNGAPVSRTTLLVLLCGPIGACLFTIVYLIEGITRSGYNAWQQPVSVLSLGPGGWVQQVNFIVFGVISLCTVPAMRQVLKGGLGAIWYPIIRVLSAFSFIMLGFFSQDPVSGYPPGASVLTTPTLHGMIHIIFSFVSFLALAAGSFVIARRFAREPRWHGWALYSIINGLLAIVFIALYGILSAQHSQIAGVFERLPGLVDTIWAIFLLIRLFRIQREAAGNQLPQRA